MDPAALYPHLPTAAQNLALSAVGWTTARRRYGRTFRDAYLAYRAREQWPASSIETFQARRLAQALERASRTPYYSSLFAKMGAEWQDFLSPHQFRTLPIVTKSDIQQDPQAFEVRPARRSDVLLKTSGTTGTSLTLPSSGNVDPEQWAVWWRYRNWHQIQRGTPLALFASSPVAPQGENRTFWRKSYTQKETRYSVYHISRATVQAYVAQLDHDATSWIHGNPSAIALLAHHMNQEGLRLKRPLRWLTVGSENLTPSYAETLQDAFGVSPIQHYGLAEANANFSECPAGRLHVDEDFAFTEFIAVADDSPQARIVGTAFANDRSAILRYDTGDLATLDDSECPCGRWGRIVASLDGRQGDYITLPSGARVASLASPFHATDWLAEAQLYQGPDGSVEVRYVPRGDVTREMLTSFEQKLRKRVGDEIHIQLRQVTAVPRTPRGKVRLVVSDYNN